MGWERPDFTFKAAGKEQERGLEPALAVPWVHAEIPALSDFCFPSQQPMSHMPKASRAWGSAPKMKLSSPSPAEVATLPTEIGAGTPHGPF